MGARGALKCPFRYPDLFGAAKPSSGGAIDLERTEPRFVLNILMRNLDADPTLVRSNNIYHFLN